MTKILSAAAFLLGAMIVVWMGLSFMGSNLLALMVTIVIGIVYVIGFAELLRFQRDTRGLENALATVENKVTVLGDWLSHIAPTLQTGVRLRIQGEHVPLPAPMLTPYLVGLLVMLGLLGTFAGMVDTLRGAVSALEGTNELEAIRAGLAAPIKGLSLAFGTSVAGVSASAMLGFISTLSRRQRALASQLLDSNVTTTFQDFSLAYHREQTYRVMQEQAVSLPAVAQSLTTVAERLEHFSRDLSQQLLENQEQFHRESGKTYTTLANSVESSLKQGLDDSRDLIGSHLQQSVAELKPLISDMVTEIAQDTRTMQSQLMDTVEHQVTEMTHNFAKTSDDVAQVSQQTVQALMNDTVLNSQNVSQSLVKEIQQLLGSTEQLVEQRIENESQWLERYEQRMQALSAQQEEQFTALRNEESRRGDAAVAALKSLNTDAAKHLQALGAGLELPMSRLIETASETPRAAAEVISQLRSEISNTMERDNQLLIERQQTFEQLNRVATALTESSSEQRDSLQTLASVSAEALTEIGKRFSEQVETESTRLNTAADHFSGSAIELTSLTDAFGLAVTQFSQSNRDVGEMLNQVNKALESSTERSDEQMAYYVAQAREIIDHTIVSQQEVIEQLRQLGRGSQVSLEGSA